MDLIMLPGSGMLIVLPGTKVDDPPHDYAKI